MMTALYIRTLIGAVCVGAVATLAGPASAERAPRKMGKDVRVRDVFYNPTDVIRVDTNLRVNTAIELGPGEKVNQVLLGDSESYEVQVLSNRSTISVKPVIAHARTNMTIYTNQHAISFYLTEGRSKYPTYRVVVDFPKAKAPARKVDSGIRDTGYEYSGKANFRPIRVWNDGRNTFFEFRNATRPSIFAVNPEAYEISVNTVSRGNIVRVAGVQSEYSLRIGEETVCIRHIKGGMVSSAATVAYFARQEF